MFAQQQLLYDMFFILQVDKLMAVVKMILGKF